MGDVLRSEVDDADVKRLPVVEFVDGGYLQEVNRRLLHPLGLALEVERATEPTAILLLRAEDVLRLKGLIAAVREHRPGEAAAMDALEDMLAGSEVLQPGEARLSSVWDCRDDPAGVCFADDVLDAEKGAAVTTELNLRSLARIAELGYVVQPLDPARCDYRGVEGDRCELAAGHDGPHEWPSLNARLAGDQP